MIRELVALTLALSFAIGAGNFLGAVAIEEYVSWRYPAVEYEEYEEPLEPLGELVEWR